VASHRSARTKTLRPWLGAALAAGAATAMVAMVSVSTAPVGSDAMGSLAASTTASTPPGTVVYEDNRTAARGGDIVAPGNDGLLGVNVLNDGTAPAAGASQLPLGSLLPVAILPVSYSVEDDEAKADGKAENNTESDDKAKVHNASVVEPDDESAENGDYYKSSEESSEDDENYSKDEKYSKDYSKYSKDFGKDEDGKDEDGKDDDGGNDDNDNGPAPQVSNAPVGGVAAGDGTTSPAGYVIGALALAGVGGAAAVSARHTSRRRIGRHQA
jgi:hypothetical protein